MISELVLEDFLSENLNVIESGLTLIKRQFSVKGHKIDLLCRDIYGHIVVIELKTYADLASVKQTSRYKRPIEEEFPREKVRLLLVCLDYSKNVPPLCYKFNVNLIQIKDERIPTWDHISNLSIRQRFVLDLFLFKHSSAKITSKSIASVLNMPREEAMQHMKEIEKHSPLNFDKLIDLNKLEIEYKLKL